MIGRESVECASAATLQIKVSQERSLGSLDVSNAFLNAGVGQHFIPLRPPAILHRAGLVPATERWICLKAVYGLKDSPKLWEAERDARLAELRWSHDNKHYALTQSAVHPSLWYILRVPSSTAKVEKLKLPQVEQDEYIRKPVPRRDVKLGALIVSMWMIFCAVYLDL
eukprot:6127766-Amphidinium_carterae.1